VNRTHNYTDTLSFSMDLLQLATALPSFLRVFANAFSSFDARTIPSP
jgi:hypothetical protein